MKKDNTNYLEKIIAYALPKIKYITENIAGIAAGRWNLKSSSDSSYMHRIMFEAAPVGVLVAESDTRKFRYANPAICQMFGYSMDELYTMSVEDIHPKQQLEKVILSEFMAQARGIHKLAPRIPCMRKDGKIIYADINTSPFILDGKEYKIGFFTDVTELHKLETALAESEAKFRTFLETASDFMFIADRKGRITYVNDSMAKSLGYSKDEMANKNISDILSSATKKYMLFPKLKELIRNRETRAEPVLTDAIGKEFECEVNVVATYDLAGRFTGCRCVGRDVTERKKYEELNQYMAYHDTLTGLANRRLIEMKLKEGIIKANMANSILGVMYIDLDGFKQVNDTYGHDKGDLLLKVVAKYLAHAVRPYDIVGRIGGDEFIVIFQSLRNVQEGVIVSKRIMDMFDDPLIDVGNVRITTTPSMGMAFYPKDVSDVLDEKLRPEHILRKSYDTLIKRADMAMYEAKKRGKNRFLFYNPKFSGQGL